MKPAVGTRVVLKREVARPLDGPPFFVVPEGAAGTVSYTTPTLLVVRLDEPVPGSQPWQHEVYWTDGVSCWQDDVEVVPPEKLIA